MTFPKTAAASPGRTARAPIIPSATTTPLIAPALPPLGQALRGAHWAARPPPADPAPRLAVSSVLFARPRPLGGSALVDLVLAGAQGVCAPSGRGGIRPGGGGDESAEGSVPCSAATLGAGSEVSEEADAARSTVSCHLLPHQVPPKRACGFSVLLPPVK